VTGAGEETVQPADLVIVATFAFDNVGVMLLPGIDEPCDPVTAQGPRAVAGAEGLPSANARAGRAACCTGSSTERRKPMRRSGHVFAAGAIACALVVPAGPSEAQSGKSGTQFSAAEVREASRGTWSGRWNNDRAGRGGELTIRVDSAEDGRIAGGGAVTGQCPREFTRAGWDRDSLVEMAFGLPDGGAGCPAATGLVSVRLGRRDERSVGIGHWADVGEDGSLGGRGFGFIEPVKD